MKKLYIMEEEKIICHYNKKPVQELIVNPQICGPLLIIRLKYYNS